MQESLEASLVRILTASGQVIGAGFLVGAREVLTCAHVAAAALGLADDAPEKPELVVSLDFPRVAPGQQLTARVVLWRPPRADGGDDIAGLELVGEPPTGARPAPLAQVEDLWEHSFRAFGFPRGQDTGVWATGRLLGRQVTNWVQIEDIKETGFAVEPGFSGTPVWDSQVEAVVGMIVAAEKRTNLKTAFAIPVDVLTGSWPLLASRIHPFVFLCYARTDSERVIALKTDLQGQGISIWIDREGLQPGSLDWEEALRTAIRAARAVLLIASPNARSSRYVRDELRIAELYQRPVYPLWIAGTHWMDAVPLGWGTAQYIDARESRYETAMPELVGVLNTPSSTPAQVSESDSEPRNPYKGLRAFNSDDAADFFGRDTLINELATVLEGAFAAEEKSQQCARLLPMAIPELREVIEKPAALPDVQLTFEGDLVGDLLFEVQGQAGALPLLQFTLDQLFQRRSGRQLTLSAYRELGGVKGALTRKAEETYNALPSDEHRKLARALFVRLIDPGVTEQDTTRHRAALSEFSLADANQTRLLQEVADAYIAARLLTTNEIVKTTTIEVSHEALIREWPRLADWLREAREDIRLQQTISEDTAEWEQHNKPGDRLYRGSQLKEARAWAGRNIPSGNEVAFLHASAAQRVRSVASVIVIVLLLLSTTGVAGWFLSRPDPTRVSNLQDTVNPGSLRYAVDEASPNSTITFDTSLRGTILLTSGDLNIARDLKILGPGADKLSISGGESDHIVRIVQGATAAISGLTFKDGLTLTGFIDNEGGTLTLRDSAISYNAAYDGGGISNSGGVLTLINSTVSGNTANDGGGIFITSSIDLNGTDIIYAGLTFSTIYGNGGGDIAIKDVDFSSNGQENLSEQVSQVKIRNSIVASGLAYPGPDISGTLISDGYNLFQGNSGATFDPSTRTQHSTDNMLSMNNLTGLFADPMKLQNNGGPTKTLSLAPDSPAVDQIPLAACHINGIITDQRGVKRPDGNEDRCDIGAYESMDTPT